ncbi:hypothetical protein RHGRI_020899 [Rhododendron griersonianum]|uniref:FF domain-containing protein n=1 Tax=Rhododendron griersonianum TaxID=479676 RepID=A0AAV6JME4_9ERIC|nr:hypothetical protein RHGRI_020899 [Rhododendron griersonianum]
MPKNSQGNGSNLQVNVQSLSRQLAQVLSNPEDEAAQELITLLRRVVAPPSVIGVDANGVVHEQVNPDDVPRQVPQQVYSNPTFESNLNMHNQPFLGPTALRSTVRPTSFYQNIPSAYETENISGYGQNVNFNHGQSPQNGLTGNHTVNNGSYAYSMAPNVPSNGNYANQTAQTLPNNGNNNGSYVQAMPNIGSGNGQRLYDPDNLILNFVIAKAMASLSRQLAQALSNPEDEAAQELITLLRRVVAPPSVIGVDANGVVHEQVNPDDMPRQVPQQVYSNPMFETNLNMHNQPFLGPTALRSTVRPTSFDQNIPSVYETGNVSGYGQNVNFSHGQSPQNGLTGNHTVNNGSYAYSMAPNVPSNGNYANQTAQTLPNNGNNNGSYVQAMPNIGSGNGQNMPFTQPWFCYLPMNSWASNFILESNHVVELVQGVIEGETRDLAASMTMEEIFKGTKEFKKELVDVPGHEYFSYLGQKTQMEAANQAREFIMTALAAKTVIFVTHQVEFLPAADMILVLKECLIVQAGKYDELLQAGTDFKALVSAHHEAIESMDIPNSSEDSDGSNPHDASIVFSKRCDSIGNNIVSLVKEVKEGLSAHKLATIKTAWLPSVLLADAYPLQFAYVCTQQMSFNQLLLSDAKSGEEIFRPKCADQFHTVEKGAGHEQGKVRIYQGEHPVEKSSRSEYIRDLEKEEEEEQKKIQKEQLKQTKRKNRDEFRKMMEEHVAAGVLTAKTHWRDYCMKVKDSTPYQAVALNTSGSTPKDLFEDIAEELEKQFWVESVLLAVGVPLCYLHYLLAVRCSGKIECTILVNNLGVCDELGIPYNRNKVHPAALATKKYGISKVDLFKACLTREWLVMKRNSFVDIFKTTQITLMSIIAFTVFLRTEMKSGQLMDGSKFYGALFFSLINVMFNGMAELHLPCMRLPVFFKQRDFLFFPAWAFALPIWLLRIPLSLMESGIWIILTYYTIGFAPAASRFFRQFLAFFGIHQMALSLFRFIAALGRTQVVASTLGTFALLVVFVFGGFIVAKDDIQPWMRWGYYIFPMMYGQNAIAMNEFLDKRWSTPNSDPRFPEPTVGKVLLKATEKKRSDHSPMGRSSINMGVRNTPDNDNLDVKDIATGKRGMVLPFQPLSLAFDHVNYYVDMPAEMKSRGIEEARLQLLQDVSGAFRPGVLTALVGVTGAGKTTLMDVLAGRKTGGYIEGCISISSFPKNQATFARISGYCEQNDIHSPHVTVHESIVYSAWLCLAPDVNKETRKAGFVSFWKMRSVLHQVHANCVITFWSHGSKLLRCKCPICSQSISKLTPETSLTLSLDDEIVEALEKVQEYNRHFEGGVRCFILFLRQLLFYLRVIWAETNALLHNHPPMDAIQLSKLIYHRILWLWRMFYIGLYNPDKLMLNYAIARTIAVSSLDLH